MRRQRLHELRTELRAFGRAPGLPTDSRALGTGGPGYVGTPGTSLTRDHLLTGLCAQAASGRCYTQRRGSSSPPIPPAVPQVPGRRKGRVWGPALLTMGTLGTHPPQPAPIPFISCPLAARRRRSRRRSFRMTCAASGPGSSKDAGLQRAWRRGRGDSPFPVHPQTTSNPLPGRSSCLHDSFRGGYQDRPMSGSVAGFITSREDTSRAAHSTPGHSFSCFGTERQRRPPGIQGVPGTEERSHNSFPVD